MLLNFKFTNFRSFKEETIFTMIPTAQKMHSEYLIKFQNSKTKVKTLPAAVIYGANASGKSNVVLAMYILKKIVTLGTLDLKSLNPYLDVMSFIHDDSYYKPTKFEITFSQNRSIFRYGLSLISTFGKHSIVDEYLYINEDEIFTRNSSEGVDMPIHDLIKNKKIENGENSDEKFYGVLLSKLNKTLDSQQLFLFSGIKNIISNTYFIDIQSWFAKFNVVMDANDVSFNQTDLQTIKKQDVSNDELSNRKYYESETIKEILNFAEFGNQEIQFFSDTDRDDLSMVSLYKLPQEEVDTALEISLVVKSELMESKGTIQLIRLIQPFIDALKTGGVVILDEMDASLHFEIVVSLIRIFNNVEINKTGAQLIFNTHNPIYLDGTLLRHDQIIMVMKDKKELSSELYSLSDYKLRPEERILKNYLNGKYGALPHMDLEMAFKHILEREVEVNG